MPAYQPYATKTTTPSRNARKSSRRSTFVANKGLRAKINKAKKVARKEAAEALEQANG